LIEELLILGSPTNENEISTSIALPSDTTNNDPDGGFTLDDLASEYLQNEPTPSSSNDKPTTSSESEEPDLSLDDLSKNYLSSPPSTPSTSVLSTIVFPPLSNEPIVTTSPLESILYSNRLSSHDAADDADCIWKKESSPFGQMFCTKSNEIQTITVKRISTCLLDRSLYERLTRLIALLPKQCIRNSVQQLSIRHNDQQSHRPPRSNNEYRRPTHRPSFQQNSLQSYPTQRHPTNQNPRQYSNASYSNQQGNFNGYFVDRRSQQQNRYPPPPFAPYPSDQQQQQNRYPPQPFAPYPPDQQQQQQQNRYPPDQQKGPPKNNSYNNNNQQQQKKKSQTNNQQASNQHQQQRGPKKGPGGGKSFVSIYCYKKINCKAEILISLCLTNR
jgi:hypothetical protein